MNTAEWIKIKERDRENRKRLLAINPYLTDNSGIYVFTREDENGFKFAYIGQAKKVLTRLSQHLNGYKQYIDKSIRKHGLWSEENPTGWFVIANDIPEQNLDEAERRYEKRYAEQGCQLRNKTIGGQNKGKVGIAENKPSKGYYDGKKQGRSDVIKELKQVVKYLQITPQNDGKLANRMLEKFWAIVSE